MDKIKVLVVDDHPMVLEGMRSMLAQISFVEISGTVSNALDKSIKMAIVLFFSFRFF